VFSHGRGTLVSLYPAPVEATRNVASRGAGSPVAFPKEPPPRATHPHRPEPVKLVCARAVTPVCVCPLRCSPVFTIWGFRL
jgi:hypothetical protein